MKQAALYTHSHDLARTLHERMGELAAEPSGLVEAMLGECRSLLGEIGLALALPGRRAGALEAADACCVRLRLWLRLADDLHIVSPEFRRHAIEAVDAIGRMLGGWQKELARADLRPQSAGR